MSPAHDQEYFCDGLAEEIINALCVIRGLRVASRTSSFQFKNRSADVREIGRQLSVSSVLEGSVRKADDRVRITVQLLNVADGYQVWSQRYDRKLEDVFAVQTEIAERMVDALRISLSAREVELLGRGGTRNGQAYDFFLKGQQLLHAYSDISEAAAMFRRSIAEDAGFAQAHAGLANALAVKGQMIEVTPAEFEEAFAASRRALELEPWMPEAMLARACLMSMQGREQGRRAISRRQSDLTRRPITLTISTVAIISSSVRGNLLPNYSARPAAWRRKNTRPWACSP